MFNEGNQIHNLISSSGSGTVINYGSGSGSDFLTSYGSGSGSTSQKVTVPKVPVPVPQHWSRIGLFPGTWNYDSRVRVPAVLRIRDVYPGSDFFHPWFRIRFFPSRIHVKDFRYFNPKNFLSSRKNDAGCSSRILIFYPSRIQGSRRHWIRIRSTDNRNLCSIRNATVRYLSKICLAAIKLKA